MDRAGMHAWVALYERAWRTPGTELLAELFAPGATYQTAPFEEPFRGLPAIAAMWEAEREGPAAGYAPASIFREGYPSGSSAAGPPARESRTSPWPDCLTSGRCSPWLPRQAKGRPPG